MISTLLVPLIGPMQSWGSRSRFDDRDTHSEPTKSGVIGLICAALGRRRGDSIDDLADLRFGVRVDAPGRVMIDFQTGSNVALANGLGTTTVTTNRHYLADARFLVGLEASEPAGHELLAEVDEALHNPVWTLSLGCKANVLSFPPYIPGGGLRTGKDLLAALHEEPWRCLWKREPVPTNLRIVLDDPDGDAVQMDNPRHFGRREFGSRRIRQEIAYPVLDGGRAALWLG